MTKNLKVSLVIHLPDEHDADRLSVAEDGSVRVFDKAGKEINPKKVERSVHYDRPKGPKFQTRSRLERNYASVGGLDELARLDHFMVIDTNTIEIAGTKVSAAFFIVCRILPENGAFRVTSRDGCGHVYELHDVPGNPEMLAILKIAHDTLRTGGKPDGASIGFITDSEMDTHERVSKRELPIYADKYLPEGFLLTYASAETGKELANRLIKFCDRESAKYLDKLRQGSLRSEGLATLAEDSSVRFRYTYYPSLRITNPVVTDVTTTPDTTYSVQFE
jgi:hypothetical protein